MKQSSRKSLYRSREVERRQRQSDKRRLSSRMSSFASVWTKEDSGDPRANGRVNNASDYRRVIGFRQGGRTSCTGPKNGFRGGRLLLTLISPGPDDCDVSDDDADDQGRPVSSRLARRVGAAATAGGRRKGSLFGHRLRTLLRTAARGTLWSAARRSHTVLVG